MAQKNKKSSSLEREVIFAVATLYVLLCGAMLLIHYLQPTGRSMSTSSTSPSHQYINEPVSSENQSMQVQP